MSPELLVLLTASPVIARRDHPRLHGALDWALRRRELVAVLPSVYARPDAADDWPTRVAAALRRDPDAVVTGRAAARLTFWPSLPAPVVTAATPGARRARPGIRFDHRRVPPHLVLPAHGVRVTTPALTALDLCGELGGDPIDQVLRTRAARLSDLWGAFADTSGRTGNRERLRLLVASRAEPWSAAERRLHQLLWAAGIDGWKGNMPVRLAGRRYYLDVAFRRLRLVVEVDGVEFHRETFESDRQRHNALVLDGWLVLRITWRMLVDEPEVVVGQIRAAMRMRATRTP